MRHLAALAVLLFASGCSLLLDESPNNEVAPTEDASVEADAAPMGCEEMTARALLITDTIIADGAAADQTKHTLPTLTVGDELASVGLLRFDLEDIPEGAQVLEGTLTLPHASAGADDCGQSGPCTSCADITRSGGLEIFLGTNDWTPQQVTWNSRGDGRPWPIPGANGEGVRLALLDTVEYLKNQPIVFSFSIESIPVQLDSEVTFILDATSDVELAEGSWTKLAISSRENECGETSSVSELVLSYCLPE